MAKREREMRYEVDGRARSACAAMLALTIILFSATSCGTPGGLSDPNRANAAADTTVRLGDLSAILAYYNGVDAEGRATGTRGFARSALYTSRRLATYGLQPVIKGEFARFYPTPLNLPRSAAIRVFTPDTLLLRSGEDVYPDGRSRTDSLGFRSVLWAPDSSDNVRGRVVGIAEEHADSPTLRRLVSRGVRAVLIRGDLDIRPYTRPIEGLTAVRVRQEAFDLLVSPGVLRARENTRLLYQAELQTAVEQVESASAFNVLAMIPGSDPSLRNELVIVGARLDGFGAAGNLQLTDGSDLGVAAAALLESSRVLSELQRWWHPLKRSVLVAFWSGSMEDDVGLRAFLEYPPWASHAIRTVLDVSSEAGDDARRAAVIRDHGFGYAHVGFRDPEPKNGFQPRAEVFTLARRRDLSDEAARLVSAIVDAVTAHSGAD